jgi:hypothetical protein
VGIEDECIAVFGDHHGIGIPEFARAPSFPPDVPDPLAIVIKNAEHTGLDVKYVDPTLTVPGTRRSIWRVEGALKSCIPVVYGVPRLAHGAKILVHGYGDNPWQ